MEKKNLHGLQADNEPLVMDIDDLAKYLKLNKRTLYRLIKEKKIPAARIGGILRFPRWIIDRWLESLVENSTNLSDLTPESEPKDQGK